MVYSTQFNKHDPKYTCCCQRCHVTTGVKIFGVIEIIALLLAGIKTLMILIHNSHSLSIDITICLIILTNFAVLLCLFKAVRQQEPSLLVPHIIFHGISLMGILIGVVFALTLLVVGGSVLEEEEFLHYTEGADGHTLAPPPVPDHKNSPEVIIASGITLVLILVTWFAFTLWSFLVQFKCCRYFKDRQTYNAQILTNEIGAVKGTRFSHTSQSHFTDATVPVCKLECWTNKIYEEHLWRERFDITGDIIHTTILTTMTSDLSRSHGHVIWAATDLRPSKMFVFFVLNTNSFSLSARCWSLSTFLRFSPGKPDWKKKTKKAGSAPGFGCLDINYFKVIEIVIL